jgi:hypothetical protein
MRTRNFGVAALFAMASVAAAVAAAPMALADSCDPAVTTCQGDAVAPSDSSSPDYAPQVTADAQYPFDGDWYFNPAGGGTVLQPEHSSGGGGGGGGHH